MDILVISIHILACLFLIVAVLLQSGQEGMGVIFGGGSGSVFGSTGAGSLLVKTTAVFSAIFLITSLGYNILIYKHTQQKMDSIMLGSDDAIIVPDFAQKEKPASTTFIDPVEVQKQK